MPGITFWSCQGCRKPLGEVRRNGALHIADGGKVTVPLDRGWRRRDRHLSELLDGAPLVADRVAWLRGQDRLTNAVVGDRLAVNGSDPSGCATRST